MTQATRGVRGRTADRGYTLIEIVCTITLMGIVVVGILAAVRTSVVASSTAYDGAEIETVLLNATDRVNRAVQQCNYEAYADAAATAEGWPKANVNSSVELLVANTGSPGTDWGAQPCPANVGAFDVQRIVISATSPDGGITRSITVVKSSVD